MRFYRLFGISFVCLLTLSLVGLSQNTPGFATQTPLVFEPVMGQSQITGQYLANGSLYRVMLEDASVAYQFTPRMKGGKIENSILTFHWIGDHSKAQWRPGEPLAGKRNYLRGSDSSRWVRDVPLYEEITEIDAIPGVNIRYYRTNANDLEYDLTIAPSVDLSSAGFTIEGADQVNLCEEGALCVRLGSRQVRFLAPHAYELREDGKVQLKAEYLLADGNKVQFSVPNRTPGTTLIIDPALVYSTFLSGSLVYDWDNCEGFTLPTGIAVDPAGNFYVTGYTDEYDFPVTPNAFMKSGVSNYECLATPVDGFVTKFSSSGQLLYSTYLTGDNGLELTNGGSMLAVDTNGNAYVVGSAYFGFPTTPSAYMRTCASGGSTCAFLAKLNAAGSDLLYATYLGGEYGIAYSATSATGIALGKNDHVFLVGNTTDASFPTTAGAYKTSCTPDQNGFITCGFAARFNTVASGSQSLIFSTLIGDQQTTASAITLDKNGDAYVVGNSSTDLPKLASFGKGNSSYVLKLNGSKGYAPRAATILRGATPTAVAVDGLFNIFVAGSATAGFATTAGAFQTTFRGGDSDGFVTKLTASGYKLQHSSFIGGSGTDVINSIAVNGDGLAFVTGVTYSSDFPITAGAIKKTSSGMNSFVTAMNGNGSGLYYSTYLGGGSVGSEGKSLVIDAASNAYIAGDTFDQGFPTTPNAYQPTFRGSAYDTFIAEVAYAGDLSLTAKTAATSVPKNATVTYNARVFNAGPDDSDYVWLADPIPAGMSYAGVDSPNGDYCTGPKNGATSGTVHCRRDLLAAGQTWYVNVYLRAVGASNTTTTNVMSVSAETKDLWPDNNTVSIVVKIQ